MAIFEEFKNIALLMLNFLFSYTLSNYISQEVDLIKSSVSSLKLFSGAYCLGYVVLVVITSKSGYSRLQVLVPPVQQNKGRYIFSSIVKWIIGIIIFHCVAVLYGAAISSNVEETFLWSVLMSTLVILPCLQVDSDEILKTIAGKQENYTLPWCLFNNVVVLTLAGAWVGTFAIPLDWDRDWQVWPIPCAAGAMVGHFVGLVMSGTLLYWQYRTKEKNKCV